MTLQFGVHQNVEAVGELKVIAQTFSNGESYGYTFLPAPLFNGAPLPIGNSIYTDAAGKTVSFFYDFPLYPYQAASCTTSPGSNLCPYPHLPTGGGMVLNNRQMELGPARVVDQLQRTTRYNYCDRNAATADPSDCLITVLQDVTLPSGLKTELYYVGTGRVGEYRQIDPTHILQNRSVFQEFGCSDPKCELKPTKVTDMNGNATDFVYSTAHGGLLTETDPPDSHGVRPQKRYTYVQRYAWVKSGASYIHANAPVWLLQSTSTCRTSAASGSGCSVSGDEVVTTLEYGPDDGSGPNNLWVRGQVVTADGTSHRTCSGYDQFGRKISETRANANPTVCP